MQVRTHAQKYFQKINRSVRFGQSYNDKTCTKNMYSDSRRRSKELQRPSTQEPVAKPTTTSSSPVSVIMTDSASQPAVYPKVEVAPSMMEPKVENAVFVDYSTVLTPRSPISVMDNGFCDNDCGSEPYRCGSAPGMEYLLNFDSVELFDCSELRTPVFE